MSIESSAGSRALVVERLEGGVVHVDLLHAAAAVGRVMGQTGASPTLAALTVDHLREAMGLRMEPGGEWIAPVRASLLEAFAVASVERVRSEAALRWAYPRCAVPLDKGTISIACGHPDDDADALASWADRTAVAVARAGYRHAHLAGGERATTALRDALDLIGVTVVLH